MIRSIRRPEIFRQQTARFLEWTLLNDRRARPIIAKSLSIQIRRHNNKVDAMADDREVQSPCIKAQRS